MPDATFHLTLFGAIALHAPSGKDITPRLRKSRALLAYLAMNGGRGIERCALEQLLWPDRAPRQARDSLKQALSDIRRAFGATAPGPLRTKGGAVHLALDHLAVDALQDPPAGAPQFLEGFDAGAQAFAAWIEQQRRALGDACPSNGTLRQIDTAWRNTPRQFTIEIAVPLTDSCAAGGRDHAAINGLIVMVQDGLRRGLDQTGFFAPLTLDTAACRTAHPDLRLTVHAFAAGPDIMLSLAATRLDQGTPVWSWLETMSLPIRDASGIYTLIAQAIEQLCDAVWQANRKSPFALSKAPALAALNAIRLISRLTPENIAAAEVALNDAMDGTAVPSLYAWRAYLTAYQLEKRCGAQLDALRDTALHYSAHAIKMDSHSPLTRALVAHVYGFVLKNRDRAQALLSPVRGLVGQNAMLADTVSLAHFYAGRYDEAGAHAQLAGKLGRWNPMQYAFTTVQSASQLMLGQYDAAIRSGKRALAQHPPGIGFQYEPTLRTLAAAYSLSGRKVEGRAALDVLERQNGTDTHEMMKDLPDTLFPNPDVFRKVRDGIQGLSL
ncbi:hypothetical protein [Loktanella salsilacus]|uniref:hypothetical protein n=1 Tax=Loktanella salsilacus TaxID=195913 RepID=UPI003735F8AB